jgi:hypothetical protein
MKMSKTAKLNKIHANIAAKIVSKYKQLTLEKLHDMLVKGELHPDPVSQRPATIAAFDNAKNKRIIECIMDGTGIGLMIVRDIQNCDEEEVKRLYPNYKALVIDGGHRTRAIKLYMNNKFAVTINGVKKKYRDLSDDEKHEFLNTQLMLEYKVCTSLQAIEIFRSVNSTTKVNAYEMIMANDQSAVCKYVRTFSKSYPEYQDNDIHPIFDMGFDADDNPVAKHFSTVNERAIWHTYTFIALHKAIGHGNVDAGDKESKVLIEAEVDGKFYLTNEVSKTVDRFFNDLLAFQKRYKTKINIDIFGAFQCVWFELFRQHKTFKIDMDDFEPAFRQVRALLTGKKDRKYQNKTVVNLAGETVNIKELVRQDVKAFSKGNRQSFAAKILLEELGHIEDAGITILESQRSYRQKDRQEVLDIQKGRCFICDEQVAIEDCDLAHDTPHSMGGKVEDGVAMCVKCHRGQGLLDLDQYRKVRAAKK